VDLYDRAQVDSLATELSTGASLDYLVNSAGYFFPTRFLKHTRKNYHQYHDINESFFFLTQAAAQRMVDEKVRGSIVNIGSMWARQAIKATPSSTYSMAKATLHSLTQHLAMELVEHGIRVNAVSIAVVETPTYGAFIKPEEIGKTLAGFNAFHPIGRVVESLANILAVQLIRHGAAPAGRSDGRHASKAEVESGGRLYHGESRQ
jgi:NAD(P)-dependent dehydrogenase (short-subunit alcohol dehydrogenase family)